MRIGILTHPLINNYGGILQNYALQYVLRQLGHDPVTIDVNIHYHVPFIRMMAGWCNRFRLHFIDGERVPIAFNPKPSAKQAKKINANTLDFINKNINKTETVRSFIDLRKIDETYLFDAYVVGSDQVWNPGLCPWYFGSFLERENVKLISYAASFGYDDWRMNKELTDCCSRLARRFSAISVREDSAVGLCKKYLGVDATHVIDPTMLLQRLDYLSIVKISIEKKTLFSYILDNNELKYTITDQIAKGKDLSVRRCMPEEDFLRGLSNINQCVFPTVDQWINGFNNADFVITDSFHGTVFAIIFNVPFIAIGNSKRGMTRFKSLLKMFNLEDRLVSNLDEAIMIADSPVCFDKVNRILETERQKAFEFLNVLS